MDSSRITAEYRSQDARRFLAGLIGLEVFFAAVHIFIFVGPGVPWDIVRLLFDLDGEVTLPTWFATVQLFSIGAVFLLTAGANKIEEDSLSAVLALGGLFFLYLSADEGGGIHERITQIVEQRRLTSLLFPDERGGWILVYAMGGAIFLLTAGLYLWRPLQMIWHRFTRESLLILGGFGTIVVGAVGFEIVSYLLLHSGAMDELYHLEVAMEEFLEMAGASVILYATVEMAATLCSDASTRTSRSQT